MNYTGSRKNEVFTYRRVQWSDWTEQEAYGQIVGGSIEMASDAALKATGDFEFQGLTAPGTQDLLRVFYAFADDNGERQEHVLGTFLCEYSDIDYQETNRGMMASGSIDAYSVLKVLQDAKTDYPYSIARNSNAINEAQKIIRNFGLQVDFTPGTTVLSADHVFDAGEDYLTIVNWLCDTAGYSEAYPDEYGVIQLRPYNQTNNKTILFKNDKNSIMYPVVKTKNSLADTPNVVRMIHNTDKICIVARVKNLTGSAASLDKTGGREKTLFEDVGELSSKGNRLTNLINRAENRLRQESAEIEVVQFSHAWRPMYIHDTAEIQYSDMLWTGNITNMKINLSPAIKTETTIKRAIYRDIQVERSGEILRGGESS